MSRSQVERVFRYSRLGTPGRQIFLVQLNETASKRSVVLRNAQFTILRKKELLVNDYDRNAWTDFWCRRKMVDKNQNNYRNGRKIKSLDDAINDSKSFVSQNPV